jgi:hypothetical protein
MSLYAVHQICRDALNDDQFRAALQEHPDEALESYDLDAGERDALLRGDVADLYTQGAHEYVLMWLARAEVLGLTVPVFMQRITAAEPHYVY